MNLSFIEQIKIKLVINIINIKNNKNKLFIVIMYNKLIIILFIIILTSLILLICFKDNFIDDRHIKYFKERNSNKLNSKIERISSKYQNIKIYIVNLEKHSDRKLHMINFMNNFGFKNYEFIKPISLDIIKKNSIYKKFKLSYGKISHILTFLNIFKENKNEFFFIMEDDIEAYSNISINNILNNAMKYYFDLLYLEMCFINCNKTKLIDEDLYLIKEPMCTACILYNKNFTDKILKIYNDSNYDYLTKYNAIDVVFSKLYFKYIGFPYFRQNPTFNSSLRGSSRYNIKNAKFDKICM